MHWLIAIFELVVMVWFTAVGLEAMLQRAIGMRVPFDLFEFHHAYLGVGLVVIGLRMGTVTGIFVQCLGVVVTCDDLYQHHLQAMAGEWEYRSPLHRLFAATLWEWDWIRWLTRTLDRAWVAIGVLGLLALWIFGCASPAWPVLVPSAPRPDTRRIMSFELDSALVREAAAHFLRALPNEASLCFDGELAPRPDRPGFLHVRLTSVRPALADSVDQHHVFLTRSPKSGCTGSPLALAHDHPTIGPLDLCSHSDPDVFVLFEDPRPLFSLVFCPAGRGEVLFQDGRRGAFEWARSTP